MTDQLQAFAFFTDVEARLLGATSITRPVDVGGDRLWLIDYEQVRSSDSAPKAELPEVLISVDGYIAPHDTGAVLCLSRAQLATLIDAATTCGMSNSQLLELLVTRGGWRPST